MPEEPVEVPDRADVLAGEDAMSTSTILFSGLIIGFFAGWIIGGSYVDTKYYKPRKMEEL